MTIRDANINDLPAIVAIYNATIPSRMVTADLEPVTVTSRITWFDQHSPTNRPLWVVENETKEVIAWISFQDFYGRAAYNATAEISIYIKTNYQGKGLGKQLLQYCIDRSPELGIHTLIGYIFAHNTPSLRLFTSLGFTEWAHLPDIAVLDGVERSLTIVGKRVYK